MRNKIWCNLRDTVNEAVQKEVVYTVITQVKGQFRYTFKLVMDTNLVNIILPLALRVTEGHKRNERN